MNRFKEFFKLTESVTLGTELKQIKNELQVYELARKKPSKKERAELEEKKKKSKKKTSPEIIPIQTNGWGDRTHLPDITQAKTSHIRSSLTDYRVETHQN